MRQGRQAGVRAIASLILFALAAACAGPADEAGEALPAGENAGTASETAAAGENGGAGDAPVSDDEVLVQPEWDALDRTRDTCGMAAMRQHIGKKVDALPAGTLPSTARILRPSDRVAMDYKADRLNVLTAPDGTILQFKCG